MIKYTVASGYLVPLPKAKHFMQASNCKIDSFLREVWSADSIQ